MTSEVHLSVSYLFALSYCSRGFQASLVAQLMKNPPAMQETPVLFLSQEVPLEKR